MRHRSLVLGLVIAALGLAGCARAPTAPPRGLTLMDPGVTPSGATLGIRAGFRPVQVGGNRTALGITIRNEGSVAVQLLWDQVSVTLPNGVSHRVMHEGVRLVDRDRPMVPSTIPPGGTLVDFVYPSALVHYLAGRYGGWVYDPFIDGFSPGQTFTLYLPFQAPDGLRARTLRFRVD
jgi:hypothetical protein